MGTTCHDGFCAQCGARKYIIIGIIVLVTAIYWQPYIWHVLGVILILKGLLKWAKPSCPHCESSSTPMKKAKK